MEQKGRSLCSSLSVSDHCLMIVAVRSESEHAELFLSMYCCDSLAVGPGAAAAASPGSGESGWRKFRYSRAFSFCWVFKPHCLGVGKRGGQGVWGGTGCGGGCG